MDTFVRHKPWLADGHFLTSFLEIKVYKSLVCQAPVHSVIYLHVYFSFLKKLAFEFHL